MKHYKYFLLILCTFIYSCTSLPSLSYYPFHGTKQKLLLHEVVSRAKMPYSVKHDTHVKHSQISRINLPIDVEPNAIIECSNSNYFAYCYEMINGDGAIDVFFVNKNTNEIDYLHRYLPDTASIYCVDMNTGEVIYNKNVNTDFSI